MVESRFLDTVYYKTEEIKQDKKDYKEPKGESLKDLLQFDFEKEINQELDQMDNKDTENFVINQ